ncbi:hypothetical protein LSTR_LSTR010904 [Laodelphax striatellus]|uniref:Uncharacterized protein n=2 Tax=Laodelphax striatellus TaxID=195883 RepID=A0A482WZF8_LAOST|nr:hypothetical protein LSTR_LSTR010904 [Laodelphax striatellus]
MNDMKQQYKEQQAPALETSLLMTELTCYLDWAGIGDPLSKIYLTTRNPPYFSLMSFLFVISQLSKMQFVKNIGNLVWKKTGEPLDGVPFIVGLQTLFRHFHPQVRSQLLLYLGQYVNSHVDASVSELFGLVCIFVAILFGPTNCTQVLSSIDQNDLNFSNHSSDDDLNKLLPSTCFSNSTLDCLKSGITRMMARLESRTPLEIIPGLSLTWDLPDGQKLTSADVFNFETLMKAVNTYLGSISLKIQLLDEAVLSKGARSLEQIFNTDNSIEVLNGDQV